MSTAIVTGSGGLIGSQSVGTLIEAGWNVIGIENDMRARFFGPESSTRPVSERLVVALRFIDVLEDLPDLDELGDGSALTGAQMADVGRQPDGLGLVEDLAGLLVAPALRLRFRAIPVFIGSAADPPIREDRLHWVAWGVPQAA